MNTSHSMAINTSYRLLIVNNPLTSLFMAAWFKQNRQPDRDGLRTIGVYCSIDFDDSYSSDIENKKSIYMKACRAPLEVVVDEWVVCMPNRYISFGDSIRKPFEMMKERTRRKNDLQFIRKTLAEKNISLKNVRELWHGNSSFDAHLFYLCPDAAGFQFEHGLSEVRNELSYQAHSEQVVGSGHLNRQHLESIKQARKWLIRRIYKRWLYFTQAIVKRSVYVSLLGDEIKAAKPGTSEVMTMQVQEVIATIQSVMKSDPSFSFLSQLEGNTAVIMLMHLRPKPWGKKEADELLDYFDQFESYLYDDMKETFQKYQIKNIIFKSRFFHEEYSEEGFSRFNRLSRTYNLIFLSTYSKANYPVEFYVPILKPTMVIGLLSSGLFNSKKLLPSINTFTYDAWYNDFTLEHLQGVHPELGPLRELFFNTHGQAFKKVLPQTIDPDFISGNNTPINVKELPIV